MYPRPPSSSHRAYPCVAIDFEAGMLMATLMLYEVVVWVGVMLPVEVEGEVEV